MYDCIIIGAGAAGLAAGRSLQDSGKRVVLVEARDRIGGRAWTDTTFSPLPLELGAEFIHGEHVITHALLKQAGMGALPAERAAYQQWFIPPTLHALAALPQPLRDRWAEVASAYAALGEQPPQADCSLRDYLAQHTPTARWDDSLEQMADVLLAQTCCAPLNGLSAWDLAHEMQVDRAGKQEFRLEQGYSALLDWYSRDLDIRLNMPVRTVQWQEKIGVTTHDGFIPAQCLLLTVPVAVLRSGTIQFAPPLPSFKQQAIESFRTEPATKLIYHFRNRHWTDEMRYICHTGVAARWWTPGEGRLNAPAIITAYLTADRARRIDLLEESEALALGLSELANLLNRPLPVLQADLIQAKRVSWGTDPYALGGYAHLPPGHAAARQRLADPVETVLYFAGEATAHDSNPQTVHGAIESGLRAAREIFDRSA